MPDTARKVARELKLGPVDEPMLHRPVLNIRLGAAHLGALMAQLERSAVLAVAAYNPGLRRSRGTRARPDAYVDEWVEEIPVGAVPALTPFTLASRSHPTAVCSDRVSPCSEGRRSGRDRR